MLWISEIKRIEGNECKSTNLKIPVNPRSDKIGVTGFGLINPENALVNLIRFPGLNQV
jgi:hypothetical protein